MSPRLDAPPRNRVLIGDARAQLARLPSGSVDCCLTSPPYYQLRDYQIAGQYGLEADIGGWVDHLEAVCAELARILTPTGSLWLNLADSYSGAPREGAPVKSLLLGPERLLLRLIGQGWRVRNKLIWAKSNPMPSPVRDRLSCTHEAVYLLVRNGSYFFDLDAIRVPHQGRQPKRQSAVGSGGLVPASWRIRSGDDSGILALKAAGRAGHPLGKNPGDVWTLATGAYRGSHYAAMPLALAERVIRAGCPERRCARCRAPWQRPLHRPDLATAIQSSLAPTCACGAPSEPGLVVDPFFGTGTTALAAERHGRDWLGVELNPAFPAQADERLHRQRDRAA
ncbi:MAG: DNA-methyltransferase [Frankiaceae bacterium]